MWSQERKKPRFLFSFFWPDSCAEDSSGRAVQSLLVSFSVVDAQAEAILFGLPSSGRAFAATSSPAHAKIVILGLNLTLILLNRMPQKNKNGHCQIQT